jgi:phosphoadenosine phosphosulfate reductase
MPDSPIDNSVVERYAGLEGRDLIMSVLRDYPDHTALVSSFGAESAVLLHMISEVRPDLPVIFLDTGKLFQETLDYRDKLIAELGLTNVRSIKPDSFDLETEDPDGKLHLSSTDA